MLRPAGSRTAELQGHALVQNQQQERGIMKRQNARGSAVIAADIRRVEERIEELLDVELRRLLTAAQNGTEALAAAFDASAAVLQTVRKQILKRLPTAKRRQPDLYTTDGSELKN